MRGSMRSRFEHCKVLGSRPRQADPTQKHPCRWIDQVTSSNLFLQHRGIDW